MSIVRASLVPTISVLAARWTQFVAGRRRLSRLITPLWGPLLTTRDARASDGSGDDAPNRYRPIHFPQRGRRDIVLNDLPRPGTAEFDRLAASARRRRDVALAPSTIETAWAGDAIAALGATGAPLRWAGPPNDLPTGLGGDLCAVLTDSPGNDRNARELRSIRIRRAALELLARRAGRCGAAGVTVLLASKRPADVERAVALVAAQRDVRVQLLVGLHGRDFTDDSLRRIEQLGPPGTTVERFNAEQNLGDVLAALTAGARHELVAKWDDDDWYGTEHLSDLALAFEYSGADIVGKAAEFVYLEALDLTIRRYEFGAESYRWTLAGGTLLTSVGWLEHVGGWPSVAHGVDRDLLAATRRAGGSAYRTHGFQYVLRRRTGNAHTWSAPDRQFLATAVSRRSGLDLAFADVAEVSL